MCGCGESDTQAGARGAEAGMANVHLGENGWRDFARGGAAVGVEGSAMKVARGSLICRGESETRPYKCSFTQPHSKSASSGAKAPSFLRSTAGLNPRPSESAVCEMASAVERFGPATEGAAGGAVRRWLGGGLRGLRGV